MTAARTPDPRLKIKPERKLPGSNRKSPGAPVHICRAICSTAQITMMQAEMQYRATIGRRCSSTSGYSLFMEFKLHVADCRSDRLCASRLEPNPRIAIPELQPRTSTVGLGTPP